MTEKYSNLGLTICLLQQFLQSLAKIVSILIYVLYMLYIFSIVNLFYVLLSISMCRVIMYIICFKWH